MSSIITVVGNWRRASSSELDLESQSVLEAQVIPGSHAQIITGSHAPYTLPSVPQPVVPASAPTRTPQSRGDATDPIDDFFGVVPSRSFTHTRATRSSGTHTRATGSSDTHTRATRESRHDSRVTRFSVGGDSVLPPPYADSDIDGADLPAYSAESTTEPVTLAMYLFKFGFLFPPFWILGAMILLSPLTAPADFEPSKPDMDRAQMVQMMRRAELRWAKRCAWAVVAGIVIAGLVVAIVLAVMYS